MKCILEGRRRKKFEEIQAFLVPAFRRFTPPQRELSAQTIHHFLEERPRMVIIQIDLFLLLIDGVSWLFFWKSFARLDKEEKHKIIMLFFDSKIALFRKGFWALNTLAKLGVYSQSFVYPSLGYVPPRLR